MNSRFLTHFPRADLFAGICIALRDPAAVLPRRRLPLCERALQMGRLGPNAFANKETSLFFTFYTKERGGEILFGVIIIIIVITIVIVLAKIEKHESATWNPHARGCR